MKKAETLRTSRGHEVPVTMTDHAAAEILKENTSDFAHSLASAFAKWGRWSDRQRPWAHKLANEAVNPEAKAPEPAGEEIGGERILALFAKAAESLKYPRLTFQALNLGRIRIQRAGARSRYTGQLMVTDGRGYGENQFYGRIDLDGKFHKGRNSNPFVTDFLRDFAADVPGTIARLGLATGNCQCCGKELIDERSTTVGYGPVCAKNWGLPWGTAGKPLQVEAHA